ncbi:hypothetical protein LTR66_000024 [Elasticomyces elasticus]|nr:hypothetical protein LTR66_000024 [Elasticomyces elasticus]
MDISELSYALPQPPLPARYPSQNQTCIGTTTSSVIRARYIPESSRLSGFEEDELEDTITAPSSTASTESQTHPRQPRRRGNSRTSYASAFSVPLSLASAAPLAFKVRRSSLHARAKSLVSSVSSDTYQEEEKAPEKSFKSNKIFGDLFSGSSAPVHFGVTASPDREKEDLIMEYTPTLTGQARLPRGGIRLQPSTATATQSQSSKSSWFGARRKAPSPAPPDLEECADELLNLNVKQELFPNGEGHGLAPSSFNDLLYNAEALITRLQTSYREKVDMLKNNVAERDEAREETEEARTRVQHFKMQLSDLGAEAAEKDSTMQALIDELASERLQRRELEEEVQRSAVLVRNSIALDGANECEHRPGWRKRSSQGSGSDSGFESEPEAEGVVSSTATPLSAPALIPVLGDGTLPTWSSASSGRMRPLLLSTRSLSPGNPTPVVQRYQGSRGPTLYSRTTVAATNGITTSMREKTAFLERRVAELESTVESCLGLVAGVGS